MSTIENPPKIEPHELLDFLVTPPQEDIAALVDKINEDYDNPEYFDEPPEAGFNATDIPY